VGNVGYFGTILIGPRLLHGVSLELGRTKSGKTPKAENARRNADPCDSASNSGDLLHDQSVRRRILAFSTSAVSSYHPMHGLAEAIGRGSRRPRHNESGIGPSRRFAAMPNDVRSQAQTGRGMDKPQSTLLTLTGHSGASHQNDESQPRNSQIASLTAHSPRALLFRSKGEHDEHSLGLYFVSLRHS
jgi:hypothetical protein